MIKIYFQLVFLLGSIRTITNEHVIYIDRSVPNNTLLKIFCLNPKKLFAEYLKFAKSAIFFSATLHPFEYFCEILAEKEKDTRLSLLSPFNKHNFGLYIYSGINTYFKYRENSYQPIAEIIHDACRIKKGNYLIYFPSFSFMKNVYDSMQNEQTSLNIYCQKQNMSEKEREDFLALFDDSTSEKIGFAVLGGIFGEGIDLIGSKLIGCIIISVGLPSLCNEKDLIKNYYDHENQKGFEYAYKYHGFNRVLQAAGRVIRSEEDKGIVILIDQRFAKQEYIKLYPPDWDHYKTYFNKSSLLNELNIFWGNR